jgi:hypothetical protein
VRKIGRCVLRIFNAINRWYYNHIIFPQICFFERYLILPVNLWWNGKKYFAQFHGDDYIYSATGYTGINRRAVGLLHMIKNLENHLNKYPEDRERVTPILESLNGSLKFAIVQNVTSSNESQYRRIHRLKKMAREICNDVAKLPRNRFIAIPCGWVGSKSAHAVMIMIKRNEKGELERHLINTGNGLNFHQKILSASGTTKYQKTLGYLAEKDEDFCDPDFYQAILECMIWQREDSEKSFYEDIWITSKGKKISADPSKPTDWQKGQGGGTCGFKSVEQLVMLQYEDPKEADVLLTRLLEENLRNRFTWYKSKWIKDPNSSDRVLLENAAHHLIQRKEKGKCKTLDLTLEQEILNYIKAEYKNDIETSKFPYPSPPKNVATTIVFCKQPFTWNKDKKYYECQIDGNHYHISKNQTITFLCGFKQFLVIESDAGERKVLLPNAELVSFHKDVIAPHNVYKKEAEGTILCNLDPMGKLIPVKSEESLHLAALAFAMRRYEIVKTYIEIWSKATLTSNSSVSSFTNLSLEREDLDPTALALCWRVEQIYFKWVQSKKAEISNGEQQLKDSRYRLQLLKQRLDSRNRKKHVRKEIFPDFSVHFNQFHKENNLGDLSRRTEEIKDKDPDSNQIPIVHWRNRHRDFKLSFPLNNASLDKISLLNPGREFYLCFFHYYHILKAENCSNAEKERIKRRFNYMRGDKDPLNQHLRKILLDLCDYPHLYRPLAEVKDPLNIEQFFASLKYS